MGGQEELLRTLGNQLQRCALISLTQQLKQQLDTMGTVASVACCRVECVANTLGVDLQKQDKERCN
jgi:hypothetical protein